MAGASSASEEPIDGPPVLRKGQAIEWVRHLSAETDRQTAAKNHARSRLNDSLTYYRGPVRIDDHHAFIDDAKALRELTVFADTAESENVHRIADAVIRADNRSARGVIRDAEGALAATEDRLGPGTTNSVEAHLDNARRQLDKAERIRDRAADRTGANPVRETANAVRTYGIAVKQALVAMEKIDRETSPQVTLTRRADPIRNGSTTVNHTLVGYVEDPAGLDGVAVTATIDGRTVPLQLRGGYTNASFATTITLSERVNTIEVTAHETDASDGDEQQDRGNGNGPPDHANNDKGNGNGPPDHAGNDKGTGNDAQSEEERTGANTVVLKLDGDGLPDTYETSVTETDPLDPDSDSTATDVDEADNGTIDGREDFDGDRLSTLQERELGTDPLEADTDGDGLPDGYEQYATGTDPLDADSDDDGTPDGQEDLDEDGLVNVEEYEAGTSPQYADIDGDGLTDSQELANETDPLRADTDDDGLDDGVEPTAPFHTDPLDPDTDDDGVLDGNETYTTTASNESVGVDVTLTGQGNVAGGVTVEEQSERFAGGDRVANMSVSEIVETESTQAFESANVTIEYDDSLPAASNESDLMMVTYDREKQLYVPLNSTIDAANNTVTAETEHFSTFAVFSISNWADDVTSKRPVSLPNNNEASKGRDVVFIMDTSNRMDMRGSDPQGYRKYAAKKFVGGLNEDDRVGVVDFDNDAVVAQPLTTDFGAINQTIDDLNAAGVQHHDNLGAALQRANKHFASAGGDSRSKVALILTDGHRLYALDAGAGGPIADGPIHSYQEQALIAAERSITIHTIGIGSADWNKLDDIAQITGGTYNYVDDASELPEVFSRVPEEVQPQDSDGDGLVDLLEERGIPIGQTGHDTSRLQTDPNDPHTDDDGLTDGEEAGEYREYPISFIVDNQHYEYIAQYYELTSNPKREDPDGDGLTDDEELDLANNSAANGWNISVINESGQPYRWAGSVEQSADGTISVSSDPMWLDTDGDGLTDYAEKEFTHTDPRDPVTYEITREQAELLEDLRDERSPGFLERILSVPSGTVDGAISVGNDGLNDARSDFDFVVEGSYSSLDSETEPMDAIAFTALDGTNRTDIWFSNQAEVEWVAPPGWDQHRKLDPWDPDTDDDGVTDGQEARGRNGALETISLGGGSSQKWFRHLQTTNPVDPDTDGDGYWDGWLGVHGVGYSDNVVLYREHLRDDDGSGAPSGIQGDERVDEQVGIHEIDEDDPGAYLTENGPKYHSNVHVGELHWEADPTDPNREQLDERTSLDIEVDWIEGRNPDDRTIGGQPILDAIEDNYALYDIDLDLHRDQSLSTDQITNICKMKGETWAYSTCVKRVTLPGLNAAELNKIENEYHNDTSKVHMLFATNYSSEPEIPILSTHDPFIGPGVDGLEGHTGSPGQAGIIETAPYGTVILADEPELNNNETMTSTTMHELGHALSIGWLDDKGPGHIAECYSGDFCYGEFGVGGGDDQTPERVTLPGQSRHPKAWSIMSSTSEPERIDRKRFAFSIEELITIDFQDIPSIDE